MRHRLATGGEGSELSRLGKGCISSLDTAQEEIDSNPGLARRYKNRQNQLLSCHFYLVQEIVSSLHAAKGLQRLRELLDTSAIQEGSAGTIA